MTPLLRFESCDSWRSVTCQDRKMRVGSDHHVSGGGEGIKRENGGGVGAGRLQMSLDPAGRARGSRTIACCSAWLPTPTPKYVHTAERPRGPWHPGARPPLAQGHPHEPAPCLAHVYCKCTRRHSSSSLRRRREVGSSIVASAYHHGRW